MACRSGWLTCSRSQQSKDSLCQRNMTKDFEALAAIKELWICRDQNITHHFESEDSLIWACFSTAALITHLKTSFSSPRAMSVICCHAKELKKSSAISLSLSIMAMKLHQSFFGHHRSSCTLIPSSAFGMSLNNHALSVNLLVEGGFDIQNNYSSALIAYL